MSYSRTEACNTTTVPAVTVVVGTPADSTWRDMLVATGETSAVAATPPKSNPVTMRARRTEGLKTRRRQAPMPEFTMRIDI